MRRYHLHVPGLALGSLLLIALAFPGCENPQKNEKHVRIGLVYTAPHELINQVVDGFKEGLNSRLPQGSFEVVERHASGDRAQFSPTVSSVIAQKLDVLAPITTPISQLSLENRPSGLPVVFLAVTDPLGAGLVESLDRPNRCTGVSDLAPFKAILRFARETCPNAKRIGLPFSPEEQPAVYGRDQVLAMAPEFGFEIDARPITSEDELAPLVRSLAASCDALLIGSDNRMFEAAPLIVQEALNSGKPVFAGDSTSIKAGAIGGYTIDYKAVGEKGAELVAQVLKGESPGDLPVIVMTDGVLELNLDTARKLKVDIPQTVVTKAKKVYRS